VEHIQDYDFADGKIMHIFICQEYVEVVFKQWNCKKLRLFFEEYWEIRDSHSIGQDIIRLAVNSSKELIDKAVMNILDSGASVKETVGLNSYSFISSWAESIIFEIVAKSVRVEACSN